MKNSVISLVSAFVFLGITGCSSIREFSNPFTDASKTAPTYAVAVWSPHAGAPKGVPERGFGGRVTFFNGKSQKGLKIDGDVFVYTFDEYPGRSVSDNAPDKTYRIPAEHVKKTRAYSKELGYSYNLWIPWDNQGAEAERKTISLLVKYVPKKGSAATSGLAKCFLPGREPTEVFADLKRESSNEITLVSFDEKRKEAGEKAVLGDKKWKSTPEERGISSAKRPLQMSTTTISIPSPYDRNVNTVEDIRNVEHFGEYPRSTPENRGSMRFSSRQYGEDFVQEREFSLENYRQTRFQNDSPVFPYSANTGREREDFGPQQLTPYRTASQGNLRDTEDYRPRIYRSNDPYGRQSGESRNRDRFYGEEYGNVSGENPHRNPIDRAGYEGGPYEYGPRDFRERSNFRNPAQRGQSDYDRPLHDDPRFEPPRYGDLPVSRDFSDYYGNPHDLRYEFAIPEQYGASRSR